MKVTDRIDRIEEKLNILDKKVLAIIILLLIFIYPLLSSTGAFRGILVGFTTLEVTHNMALDPIIIFALVAGLASLFRAYLGYLKVKDKGVEWDWSMMLISVVPTVTAALGSATFLGMEASLTNLVLVFFGAVGVNSLQDKFGLQKRSKA